MKKNEQGSSRPASAKREMGEDCQVIVADYLNGSFGIALLARAIANHEPGLPGRLGRCA